MVADPGTAKVPPEVLQLQLLLDVQQPRLVGSPPPETRGQGQGRRTLGLCLDLVPGPAFVTLELPLAAALATPDLVLGLGLVIRPGADHLLDSLVALKDEPVDVDGGRRKPLVGEVEAL